MKFNVKDNFAKFFLLNTFSLICFAAEVKPNANYAALTPCDSPAFEKRLKHLLKARK
jgi:hypothetical protein